MKVSIVTVLLNNLQGFRRTAESIFYQDHYNIDWIVVDGGSSDGTAEYVKTLGTRVTKFFSGQDKGIYDAMNKGLAAASGDYVVFLNGDDRLASSGVLTALVNLAVEADYPDLIFGSSYLLFGGERRVLRRVRNPGVYIRHGQPALHQGTAFRRTTHLRYMYDLRYSVTADYAVVAAMLAGGARWRTTEEVISVNPVGGSSTSHNRRAALLQEPWTIQKEILRLPLYRRVWSYGKRCLSTFAFQLLDHRLARRLLLSPTP